MATSIDRRALVWSLMAACAVPAATACSQSSNTTGDSASGNDGGGGLDGGTMCTATSTAPGCTTQLPDGAVVTVDSGDPPGSDAMTQPGPDGGPVMSYSGAAVWTHHMNNERTGVYLAETTLTPANVTPAGFGLVASRMVDGQIYAQPLYAPGVSIGGAMHNVVYVATQHNSVYAFDADNVARAEPLWQVNLGPSVPYTAVDNCQDITPEVGILSTPVIDVTTRTIYVSAKTMEGDGAHFRLHALELETGHEKFGGPVEITGSIAGTGTNGEGADGRIRFRAVNHLQRPALTLANGVVYIGFGGWCDRDVFHGWVMAYDAATLHQRGVWADTRNGYNGGIWQSGGGFAADEHGDVYVETGDGHFDPSMNPPDLGNSVVRLHLDPTMGTLEAADWFTPFNQAWLDEHDFDLGSTGPVLLPGTNYLLASSKQGMFYLLDRGNMGRYDPMNDARATQSFLASYSMTFGHMHGVPVYWAGPSGARLFVWPEDDVLRVFQVDSARIAMSPMAMSPVTVPGGAPGGFMTLSANGTTAGSAVLWALAASGASSDPNVRPGALHAFDPVTLRELWNSDMNASRDTLGTAAKYATPVVVGGRVYAPTASNRLQVYGLLH